MKRSETERVNEWSKKNSKCYIIKLNKETDAELIKLIEAQENKNGFFKSAIRAIM